MNKKYAIYILIALVVVWILTLFGLRHFNFSSSFSFGSAKTVTVDKNNATFSFLKPAGFKTTDWDFQYNIDPSGGNSFECFDSYEPLIETEVFTPPRIVSPSDFYDKEVSLFYAFEKREKVGNNDFLIFSEKTNRSESKIRKMYVLFGESNILSIKYNPDACSFKNGDYEKDFSSLISSINFTEKGGAGTKIDYSSSTSSVGSVGIFPTIDSFSKDFKNAASVAPNEYRLSMAPSRDGYIYDSSWTFTLPKTDLPTVEGSNFADYVEALFKPAMVFKFKIKVNEVSDKKNLFSIMLVSTKTATNGTTYQDDDVIYRTTLSDINDGVYHDGEIRIPNRFGGEQIELKFKLGAFDYSPKNSVNFVPVEITH